MDLKLKHFIIVLGVAVAANIIAMYIYDSVKSKTKV
jgi:hypothetical protein